MLLPGLSHRAAVRADLVHSTCSDPLIITQRHNWDPIRYKPRTAFRVSRKLLYEVPCLYVVVRLEVTIELSHAYAHTGNVARKVVS